jgi:hypothetical protein
MLPWPVFAAVRAFIMGDYRREALAIEVDTSLIQLLQYAHHSPSTNSYPR